MTRCIVIDSHHLYIGDHRNRVIWTTTLYRGKREKKKSRKLSRRQKCGSWNGCAIDITRKEDKKVEPSEKVKKKEKKKSKLLWSSTLGLIEPICIYRPAKYPLYFALLLAVLYRYIVDVAITREPLGTIFFSLQFLLLILYHSLRTRFFFHLFFVCVCV